MLLLTSTSGQLQIVTSSAAAVDVHATWVDTNNTQITPGRKNTQVAVAATTVVVPSPPVSTQRNIKTVHVRNKDALLACSVTTQVFDGALTVPLNNTTLNPGDMLELTDFAGFHIVQRSY